MTSISGIRNKINTHQNQKSVRQIFEAEAFFKSEIDTILSGNLPETSLDFKTHLDNLSIRHLKYFLNQYCHIDQNYDLSNNPCIFKLVHHRIKAFEKKYSHLNFKTQPFLPKYTLGTILLLSLVIIGNHKAIESGNLKKGFPNILTNDKKNLNQLEKFKFKYSDQILEITPVEDLDLIKKISNDLIALAKIETVNNYNIFDPDSELTKELMHLASKRYQYATNFKIIKITSKNSTSYFLVGQEKASLKNKIKEVESNQIKIKYFQWNYFSKEKDKIPKMVYQTVFPRF